MLSCRQETRRLRYRHLSIPNQRLKEKDMSEKECHAMQANSLHLILLKCRGVCVLQLLEKWFNSGANLAVRHHRSSCMIPRRQISAPRSLTLSAERQGASAADLKKHGYGQVMRFFPSHSPVALLMSSCFSALYTWLAGHEKLPCKLIQMQSAHRLPCTT